MRQPYYKVLPITYFDNLLDRVLRELIHGHNVCISVIRGGGARTVFNFLHHHIRQKKLFDNIYIYDPEIEEACIMDMFRTYNSDAAKQKLIIIRSFEKLDNKQKVLAQIDSFITQTPGALTILGISDHTAITTPNDYQSASAIFFSSIVYIPPFNIKNSYAMIETLKNFYGWKINKNLYSKIYKLSGGLPRVVKYITKDIAEGFGDIGNEERFLKTAQINFQMERLARLIITLPTIQLTELGLLNDQGFLKSKLLKIYLSKFTSTTITNLYPSLTKAESKILTYLIENQNQILSIDKIADIIKMTDENFSLWAIYKTISRLRPKIRKNFKLRSVKGKGYILEKVINH